MDNLGFANDHSLAVVISQPMYFPWVGILEQIRLSDIFVFYNDVQYVRGFFNRVQVKTSHGVRWITVPLRDLHRGQLINEVLIDERTDWRSQHREILRQAYLKSPFREDMLHVFDLAMSRAGSGRTLADISKASVMALAAYFNLEEGRKFFDSETLGVQGRSSQRLLDITLYFGARVYITGHGARNYLDYDLFEKASVDVRYMNYQKIPYPQQHGAFTPYVSALDLVANCGKDGYKYIISNTLNWKEFLANEQYS